MTTMTEELPEFQIFSILREGEADAIGPYSQNQIVELLNQGDVKATDLVYYEGWGKWQPLEEVFDLHQYLVGELSDGQDPATVADVYGALSKELKDEPIYYIAIQERVPLSLKRPEAVVLTESRFCLVHQRRSGLEVDTFYWESVANVTGAMTSGNAMGTLIVITRDSLRMEIPRIPADQLNRVNIISAEILQATHQHEAEGELIYEQ